MAKTVHLALFLIAGMCVIGACLSFVGIADGLLGRRPEPTWKWAGIATLIGADCLLVAIVWLLARRCTERPLPAGLGRVLYEYRPRKLDWAGMTIFGILVLAAGLLPFLMQSEKQPLTTFGITLIVTAFGVWITTAGVWQLSLAVHCHEHGLIHRTLFSDRVHLYHKLESFAFNSVHLIVNGLDTGIHYGLTFNPRTTAGPPIAFGVQIQNVLAEQTGNAAALETVRDQVSEVLAAALAERLRKGETVPWVEGLSLTSHGVEVLSSPQGGRSQPRQLFLPYDRVGKHTIETGLFRLWEAGASEPFVEVLAGTANFYPGFLIFRRLTGGDGLVGGQVGQD